MGTSLFAQAKKATYDEVAIARQAQTKTEYLKQQLNLNDEQTMHVGELTNRIAFKMAAASNNKAELDAYYNTEMSNILTSTQMQKFQTLNNANLSNGNKSSNVDEEKAKMLPKE